jgi:hypothetical protein
MPWQLTLDGHRISADDMTLAECETVEEITGDDWGRLNPVLSAKHARAIATVLYRRFEPDKAERKAAELTVKELLDAYQIVEDDLPTELVDGIPLQGDGTPTVG